jgi:RNA polymerase sigma factor (sigma-70 family)
MASVQLGQFRQRQEQKSPAQKGDTTDAHLLDRFVLFNDEAAFEKIVQRHGSMVLGLCRRLVGDGHTAEDAFQATFLVLVRKAAAIKKPELLGNWLFGVAYRIALKARINAARRAEYERQVQFMPKAETVSETVQRELRSILDEEMRRLPEKYRAPLILCYLEGKTNEEAARELGWPVGSMSWRLARGREMLRQRLARRDLVFAPMLFPPMLAQNTGSTVMSAGLAKTTVSAGMVFASGKSAAATGVSNAAATLTEEILHGMWLAKIKKVGILLGIMLISLGTLSVALGAIFGKPQNPNSCHKE